ncbi:hypothetical protein Fcan01_20952 [Folsomia candida]|uniref:Uncharacterized protein n=1 Tax=Folsomia candida TaxID=158441 RepID=A0A226DGV4_FOLCA|nr:hypothetical protein Fcan01_20952 [Folsomia candida]
MWFKNYLKNLLHPPASTSYIPVISTLSNWSTALYPIPILVEKSGVIRPMKTSLEWGQFIFSMLNLTLHSVIFIVWMLRNVFFHKIIPLPVWKQVMMWYFCIIIVTVIICQVIIMLRKEECLMLLWTPIKMENFCRVKYDATSYTKKLILWVGELVKMSMISIGLAVFVLSGVMPCCPPIVTALTLPECAGVWTKNIVGVPFWLRIPLGIWQTYTWLTLHNMMVILLLHLSLYAAEMMGVWLDGVEKESLKSSRNIKSYRVTQVAEKMVNHFWRKPLMSVVMLAIIIGETSALYILITSATKLPLPILVGFTMVGVDLFVVIHITFRILSLPHSASEKLMGKMKLLQKGRDSAWLKRFVRSCPSLKIGMGDGTFFDRLTPFIIWQFCVDSTVPTVVYGGTKYQARGLQGPGPGRCLYTRYNGLF